MDSFLYGSEFIKKMKSAVYVRPTTGSKLTRPATSSAAYDEFIGKAQSDTITLADTPTAGEYFTFSTPNGKVYGWYYVVNAVGSEPTGLDVDTWFPLTLATGYTVAESKAALIATLDTCTYVKYTSGTGANIAKVTISAKQGGICDGLVDGDTGLTIANVDAGIGNWAIIGMCDDSITSDASHNEKPSSEGDTMRLNSTRTITFSYLNPDEHAIDLLDTVYDGNQFDIAFFDKASGYYHIVIYYNRQLNGDYNPMGEMSSIDFSCSLDYKSESTVRDVFTYNS